MKRRTFLATMPGVVGLAAQGVSRTSPTSSSPVTIITVGSLHPRVSESVGKLLHDLRKLNYSVTAGDVVSGSGGAAQHIIVGVADEPNRSELQRMGWESQNLLSPENWELNARPGVIFALGGDSRGTVYAISELRRLIALEGTLPVSPSENRKPAFPIRRWSTAVSHCFGSPWDERVDLAQRFAYIKSDILPRAAEYGMNSIELNGRPGDGWDIAWVIGFEKYPKLAPLFAKGERRERMALVEDLARAAHDNLLDFLVWNHELYLPPGFVELYPEVRGVDYPVCLSSEFLKAFIREKYVEFFEGVPSADGVVMSVNESGQFSLITDAGCKCARCRLLSKHERMMAVLNEVIAVCTELNKQIVLRTFQAAFIDDLHSHPELETIRRAYTGLPKQVQVMSKYCPLDFFGGEMPDEPLIGAFPNPHLVEFSLDVEWQGRTFVPVLTPDNFRRRIAHALEKKCVGVVARVDFPFPSMEPEPIFGHPNEFNAVYMGQLLWEPGTDADASLADWAKLRYGSDCSAAIPRALRKTEAITQRTFFALGQTVINYHNMISSVSGADGNLWSHALSKWDARKRDLSEAFFSPTDELIERCNAEKREAVLLASECLPVIQNERKNLSLMQYERSRYGFEKLRDTAELWGHLLELYLRHRQVASSPPKPELLEAALSKPGEKPLLRLLDAARAALSQAVEMERRHGENCWPVMSPDRGVTAYEFVNQILRHYIAGLTGEPAKEEIGERYLHHTYTSPVYQAGSTESLWRTLVEQGRPGYEWGSSTGASLKWPEKLRQLDIGDFHYTLVAEDGRSLSFPLSYPVQAISLSRRSDVVLSILKTPKDLIVKRIGG